ncbi:hypothetical protein CMK19_01145 [Candidatus Poribacteria bacterium]|nr:hypothetical protein [Candidatus Poribacteria bacterium]
MSETYPSRQSVSADVPDPEEISARFVYNFFVPDEGVNEEGKPALAFGHLSAQTQALIDNRTIERKVPRFVVLDVKRVFKGEYQEFSDLAKQERLVTDHCKRYGRFQPEAKVAVPFMETLTIEDPDLLKRLRRLTRRSVSYRVDNDTLTAEFSQTDLANALNSETPPDVTGDMILRLLSDKTEEGVTYVNSINEEILTNDLTDQSTLRLNVQIPSKFVADIQKRMGSSPFSPGCFDGLTNQKAYEQLQSNARFSTRPEIDMALDYEPEIKAFGTPVKVSMHQQPRAGTCGYIIDKWEILPNGTRERKESIFLDGVNSSKAIDSKVKYGASYSYTVSTVVLIESTFEDDPNGITGIYKTQFMLKSRPSPQSIVKCIERVPPPPPDGIFYRYDYDTDSLMIDWQFPITPQRDVKKFQIFRRKSIDEPFTLLAQYDFNNSVVKWPMTEVIEPDVNLVIDGSYTAYVDSNFDRSGDYIYTVVSVDAHNLSSNYGAQTHVKFNQLENKIELRAVSQPGAPKQFPNFYISPTEAQNINTVRLTEDVMLDSNHQTMRIYFDPEYLKIEDSEGYDQKFLATTSVNGSYKIQILNLDRQKSKIVTLEVEDKIKGEPGWLLKNNTYGKMRIQNGVNDGSRNPGLRSNQAAATPLAAYFGTKNRK